MILEFDILILTQNFRDDNTFSCSDVLAVWSDTWKWNTDLGPFVINKLDDTYDTILLWVKWPYDGPFIEILHYILYREGRQTAALHSTNRLETEAAAGDL